MQVCCTHEVKGRLKPANICSNPALASLSRYHGLETTDVLQNSDVNINIQCQEMSVDRLVNICTEGSRVERVSNEQCALCLLTCRGCGAMLNVASTLFSLHKSKIVHLDLKSMDILIASDGRINIADLFLGKMVIGITTCLSEKDIPYMAPEVFRGRGGLASDVWAFGTILWEVGHTYSLPNFLLPCSNFKPSV